MSNHLVGHAIDTNFIDSKGIFWNSKALENPTGEIFDFINSCHMKGIRWGGLFVRKDTVHFDDRLNLIKPDLWADLYNQIHNEPTNHITV